jgi:uracil-DNA glycosylase
LTEEHAVPLVQKKLIVKKKDVVVVNPQVIDIPPQVDPEVKTYDKNPHWNKSISELINELGDRWDYIFKDPEMLGIINQLDIEFAKELAAFGDHIEILPHPNLIFNAFKECLGEPKVIILGQDPYFSNLNEAMGLSFSVPDGVKKPPTLVNIFTELSTDLSGFVEPKSGNLIKWNNRGVLLLNTALTVRYKQKESHLKHWKKFADTLIKLISAKSKKPLVFMLWGAFAKAQKKQISNVSKHLVLEATHPSPLGANQGGWFGCKHFSKANDFLTKNKIGAIDWNL